jgi:hypothetical protein
VILKVCAVLVDGVAGPLVNVRYTAPRLRRRHHRR